MVALAVLLPAFWFAGVLAESLERESARRVAMGFFGAGFGVGLSFWIMYFARGG